MLKELCHPSTALFVRGKSFCTRSSTLWNGEHCLKINNYYNTSKTFRHIFSIFVCVVCVSGGGYCRGWVNVRRVIVRGVIVRGVNVQVAIVRGLLSGGLMSAHRQINMKVKVKLTKRVSASKKERAE